MSLKSAVRTELGADGLDAEEVDQPRGHARDEHRDIMSLRLLRETGHNQV